MTLQPITNLVRYINGSRPLPSGAVPLAAEGLGGIICLMPNGRWIMWLECIHFRPPETQRAVVEVIIGQLGGTAAAVGAALDVSPRTVEAWRSGKAPLPIKSAYAIAEALAAL